MKFLIFIFLCSLVKLLCELFTLPVKIPPAIPFRRIQRLDLFRFLAT